MPVVSHQLHDVPEDAAASAERVHISIYPFFHTKKQKKTLEHPKLQDRNCVGAESFYFSHKAGLLSSFYEMKFVVRLAAIKTF